MANLYLFLTNGVLHILATRANIRLVSQHSDPGNPGQDMHDNEQGQSH